MPSRVGWVEVKRVLCALYRNPSWSRAAVDGFRCSASEDAPQLNPSYACHGGCASPVRRPKCLSPVPHEHPMISPAFEHDLKASIRTIPDYPKPGIMFRDITTLLGDARSFRRAVD